MKQKTPMQELIDKLKNQLKEIKSEYSKSVSSDTYWRGVVIGLKTSIDNAELQLQKEKEVMCEFADDYQRNCFQKSSDDYYNETFNTKEK